MWDFVPTSGLAINTKQAKEKWNELKDKSKVTCLCLCFVLYSQWLPERQWPEERRGKGQPQLQQREITYLTIT